MTMRLNDLLATATIDQRRTQCANAATTRLKQPQIHPEGTRTQATFEH